MQGKNEIDFLSKKVSLHLHFAGCIPFLVTISYNVSSKAWAAFSTGSSCYLSKSFVVIKENIYFISLFKMRGFVVIKILTPYLKYHFIVNFLLQ